MSFTRKTLVTVLAVLALVVGAVGHRDRAEARAWIIDTKPTTDTVPTTGEPEVWGHVRTTGDQLPVSAQMSPSSRSRPNDIRQLWTPAVRWLGWVWVTRHLGMGL